MVRRTPTLLVFIFLTLFRWFISLLPKYRMFQNSVLRALLSSVTLIYKKKYIYLVFSVFGTKLLKLLEFPKRGEQ